MCIFPYDILKASTLRARRSALNRGVLVFGSSCAAQISYCSCFPRHSWSMECWTWCLEACYGGVLVTQWFAITGSWWQLTKILLWGIRLRREGKSESVRNSSISRQVSISIRQCQSIDHEGTGSELNCRVLFFRALRVARITFFSWASMVYLVLNVLSESMLWGWFGHPTACYYGILVAPPEIVDFRRPRYRYCGVVERMKCGVSAVDRSVSWHVCISMQQCKSIDFKGPGSALNRVVQITYLSRFPQHSWSIESWRWCLEACCEGVLIARWRTITASWWQLLKLFIFGGGSIDIFVVLGH